MLLSALPQIEDELIFSYMARWFHMSGYARRKDFMRAATLHDFRLLSVTAFSLCDVEVQAGLIISQDKVLMEHGLFPFYRHFLPKEVLGEIYLAFWERRSLAWWARRWVPHEDLMPRQLRHCPICSRQLAEEHGSPAWLRTHNLPFVEVCHVHGVRLEYVESGRVDYQEERLVLPTLSKKRTVPVSGPDLVYARKAVEVLRAGAKGGGDATACGLEAVLKERLAVELNVSKNAWPDAVCNFLRSGGVAFVRRLHQSELWWQFRSALPEEPRTMVKPQAKPAIMVLLLMLLFPHVDFETILAKLPKLSIEPQ